MDISILKMFTIIGIVTTWAAKALADRKVTLREAVDLVEPVAQVLGIPTDLEVPGLPAPPEEVVEDTALTFDKTNPDLQPESLTP